MNILTIIIILKILMWVVVIGGSIFLFLAGCSIYTNLTTGVPWAKVPKRNIYRIFKELDLPKGYLVYDLGCGDGRVLFTAEKFGHKAIGFELSLYPYLKACFKKLFLNSRAIIKRQNFFKQNLNQADIVFIFLVGETLRQVAEKLKQELRPRAQIISYGFTLPGFKLSRIINTKPSLTYIYKT